MNPKEAGIKADKMLGKMELALRYAKGIKIYSSSEISPMPKRSSRRVAAQIKKKELIG